MKGKLPELLNGLPPIADESINVLILGSFPGRQSLQKRQYYAHRQNRFWKFVGSIIKSDLVSLNYVQRRKALLENNIGLWDVIASCRRTGSLDKAICDATLNDVASLRSKYPSLKRIGFNGGKAAGYRELFADQGFEVFHLPSTSPANTGMSEVAKVKSWKAFLTGKTK